MARRVEVVGAVLKDGDLIFAAKRGAGREMAGFWEFPGGKVEAEETPSEALARELAEELQIETRVGELMTTSTYDNGSTVIVLSTFLCEIDAGSPVLKEHAEFRWVPIPMLPNLKWAPADIPTVELLQERFVRHA